MAPEVRYAGRKGVKKYSAPADWYTLGVLLYELTEQRLPFGEEPQFKDHKQEWRKPKVGRAGGSRRGGVRSTRGGVRPTTTASRGLRDGLSLRCVVA